MRLKYLAWCKAQIVRTTPKIVSRIRMCHWVKSRKRK